MTHGNGLMHGKKGLIMGVANDKSIAWGIAQQLHAQGAQMAFSCYNSDNLEKRLRTLVAEVESEHVYQCNIFSDDDIQNLMESLRKDFGGLDFIVHSIAFSNKDELRGRTVETTRTNFSQTMEASVFSLIAALQTAERHGLLKPTTTALTLSYYGAEKVIQSYNVMGIAKAALEATVRYLSADFGPDGIRVNAISAGPIRTMAATAIEDFKDILDLNIRAAPMRRNVSQEDVGKAGLYLLSDLSSGVTGEVHYVDCGVNVMGMVPTLKEKEAE